MFNIETVTNLHDQIILQYGGASGVRDHNLLDSALNRPFQTFGGEIYILHFMKKRLL